jgi:hypothetical protein
MSLKPFLLVCMGLVAVGRCSASAPAKAQPKPAAQHEKALPLTPADKVEAVRLTLAWLQGKEKLPGFKEKYGDFRWMQKDRPGATLVVCDFLPTNAKLKTSPRFRRITGVQLGGMIEKEEVVDSGKPGYVRISLREESEHHFMLEVDNNIAPRVGHMYVFTFRKTPKGLQAEGGMALAY